MKNAKKNSKFSVVLGIILCALVFLSYGCGPLEHLGETKDEARRRHSRNLAINQQEMVEDIDTALLLDKPSKLTDQRIP